MAQMSAKTLAELALAWQAFQDFRADRSVSHDELKAAILLVSPELHRILRSGLPPEQFKKLTPNPFASDMLGARVALSKAQEDATQRLSRFSVLTG